MAETLYKLIGIFDTRGDVRVLAENITADELEARLKEVQSQNPEAYKIDPVPHD